MNPGGLNRVVSKSIVTLIGIWKISECMADIPECLRQGFVPVIPRMGPVAHPVLMIDALISHQQVHRIVGFRQAFLIVAAVDKVTLSTA